MVVAFYFTWDLTRIATTQQLQSEFTEGFITPFSNRIIIECNGKSYEDIRDCVADAALSTRDFQRSEAELAAQGVIARYTKVMGWTSLGALFVGALSIYLLWRTVSLTQSTLQVTRDAGYAQSRPWIEVSVNDCTLIDYGENDLCLDLRFGATNSGRSPAQITSCTVSLIAIKSWGVQALSLPGKSGNIDLEKFVEVTIFSDRTYSSMFQFSTTLKDRDSFLDFSEESQVGKLMLLVQVGYYGGFLDHTTTAMVELICGELSPSTALDGSKIVDAKLRPITTRVFAN